MRERRRPIIRHVSAAAAVVGILVLAGCGVPVDRVPSALPRKGIPFGLLRPSAPTTTTTSTPSPVEASVPIFLVASSGHLVVVTRQVPVAEETLAAVIGALVKGPTNAEAAAGLESAVPAQTVVIGATTGIGGVATVNLGGTFGQLVGQAQIQAVAQIVFTATSVPGVTSVAFELAGQAVDVPVASGAGVAVANRLQFASLAPLA
jgi:spore germination protein GerM